MSDQGGGVQPGQGWEPEPRQSPPTPPPPPRGAQVSPGGPRAGEPVSGSAQGGPVGPPAAASGQPAKQSPGLGQVLRDSPTAPVAAAIAAAFVLAVLGDIILTFQKQETIGKSPRDILLPLLQFKSSALTGRDRILQFFDFGSPQWALALLLAVLLLVAGPRLAARAGGDRPPPRLLLLVLAALSGLVALAAVVNIVVWFSYFGRSVTLGFKGVLTELATLLIALATARWAAMAAGIPVGGGGGPKAQAAPADSAGGTAYGPGSTDPTTGFHAPSSTGDTPPSGSRQPPP
jgi:hypothetical protein